MTKAALPRWGAMLAFWPRMRSASATRPRKGISVQLFIALAIICSTALLGSVLAWQNYHSVRSIMVSAAGDSALQLSRALRERARLLIEPPRNVLHLLAYSPLAHDTTLQQRLDHLPLLVESLNANDMLSAIYVGYPNGEFMLLRELNSPQIKERFAAPSGSEFLVQTISVNPDGAMVGEWRFYDQQLGLLQASVRPDYQFDPRSRPWFTQAATHSDSVIIKPYRFFTTGQAGITLAQRAEPNGAIIGMDVAIDDLNSELTSLQITPSAKVAVISGDGTVVAYPDLHRLLNDSDITSLPHIDELGVSSLSDVYKNQPQDGKPRLYHVNGQDWYGMRTPLLSFADVDSHVLFALPANELLHDARQALMREIIWVTGLTLLLVSAGWVLSRRISRPLRQLTEQLRDRSDFDFSTSISVTSPITEVRELDEVLGRMSRTIQDFQDIALALNHETQLDHMLDAVLEKLVDVFHVQDGAVYLIDADSRQLKLATRCSGIAYPDQLDLQPDVSDDLESVVAAVLEEQAGYLCVQLADRHHERLGVLVLRLTPDQQRNDMDRLPFSRFVHKLSGAAAVAIETRQLIEAQQRLLDAIIKLLANAIDAKSPYTGGHCERVPLLAELLLKAAMEAKGGPYADFDMSQEELYEFRIAAWLHDCGKISSPESVMDKATKLEMQYNRIHEIRMRFEVLWRDAVIEYWKGIADGGDPHTLQEALAREQAQLHDDFAFVANANIGGEFMDSEDIRHLERIGARRWWRQFDNRLGLARHEMAHLADPAPSLPVQEYLLADRPDHIVPWGERKPPVARDDPNNIWGFDMRIPTNAYNYGELYNLSIRRGTLTDEERFKINEHIVQTIIMLNSLPLPRHLKRIPEIAGNHHEKMDGTGYPRRLNQDRMSIPERVMMIADIFEALTATDRPYKPAKTLSESMGILTNMARDGHIDPELFRLFLTSGVYLDYSRQFLAPEQIDDIDVQSFLDLLHESTLDLRAKPPGDAQRYLPQT